MTLVAAAKLLKRPWVVISSIVAGVAIGLYSPLLTHYLAPLSLMFFALLKMCALPIVMTAVILSFARLWSSGHVMQYLSRVSAIFVIGLMVCSFMGSALAIPVSEHLLKDPRTFETLGKLMGPRSQVTSGGKVGLATFVVGVIPKNIFRALSEGEILGTLIFVILLGIAIGSNEAKSLRVLLLSFEGLNEAFFRMIDWFTYLLPFALCSSVAQTIGGLDGEAMGIIGKLFGFLLVGVLMLVTMQLTIARYFLRVSWKQVYLMIREPGLIALSSSSSLASLPSLTRSLECRKGADRWLLDLILPIGITFCQQSTVFFYSFLALFVAKVYGIHIGPVELVLIGVGAYLHSMASAGLPAAASIGFLAAVFRPIGIPVETLGVILVAVMPLIDPFLTLANITGQLVSVSATSRLLALDGERPPARDSDLSAEPDLGLDV